MHDFGLLPQRAVTARILELCNERGITVNALATLAAVPPSTLKNILCGNSRNPGIVTIKMLCDGLEISLEEFFSADVFKNLLQELE
ncbi:MAG: helix-turn-helix transcriptional regulator [Oscillospiraceae bacterium]